MYIFTPTNFLWSSQTIMSKLRLGQLSLNKRRVCILYSWTTSPSREHSCWSHMQFKWADIKGKVPPRLGGRHNSPISLKMVHGPRSKNSWISGQFIDRTTLTRQMAALGKSCSPSAQYLPDNSYTKWLYFLLGTQCFAKWLLQVNLNFI